MTKIYLATSWKNKYYEGVLSTLSIAGYDVYDFRQEGFGWQEIDKDWKDKFHDHKAYLEALNKPRAEIGFKRDFDAMRAADICVVLTPSGRSAHMEFGWMIGQGKPGYVLLTDPQEWDLMYKMANKICLSTQELLTALYEGTKK